MIDRRLESLRSEVLEMHELARRAVEICVDGLEGDEEKRRECEEIERSADVLNTDVDFHCGSAIALFQPVARDLRFILSMIRISSSYERITDLAQTISTYTCEDDFLLARFRACRDVLLEMFDVIRRAHEGETEGLRERLSALDDRVDRCYEESIGHLAGMMCPVELILAARYLERIGDLLGKIGARIIFIESGRRVWIK